MTAATNLAGLEPKALVTGGISIRYYGGGEGEPLLLLHGLAGSRGELGRAAAGPRPAASRDRRRPAGACRLGEGAARHEHRRLRGRRRSCAGGRGRRAGSRRRPLVRWARRTAARASPAGARSRPAARLAGGHHDDDAPARVRSSSPRRRCAPAAGWRRCAIATAAASGTAGRSSARGSSRMRPRSARARRTGCSARSASTRDTKTAARAMNADDPRRDLAGVACPVVDPVGRARPAAAARRCVRVHAPARRAAPRRRRLRAPRDRREAGGLP